MQSLTRVEIVSQEGSKRKTHHEHGFVDVEDEQIVVVLNNDQINKLKYYPPRKKPSKPDEEIDGKIIKQEDQWWPEKWVGYCNATKECHKLDDKFVTTNFTAGFLEECKALASHGSN